MWTETSRWWRPKVSARQAAPLLILRPCSRQTYSNHTTQKTGHTHRYHAHLHLRARTCPLWGELFLQTTWCHQWLITHTHIHTTIFGPSHRSICVSRHPQLTTGGHPPLQQTPSDPRQLFGGQVGTNHLNDIRATEPNWQNCKIAGLIIHDNNPNPGPDSTNTNLNSHPNCINCIIYCCKEFSQLLGSFAP